MKPCAAVRHVRAFTLIELLVAIGVSVVLLSILAFVFRISASATRDATSRVALTERSRSLNIRMRQEFGGMLPIQRLDAATGKPYADKRTFDIGESDGTSGGKWIKFATATVEGGRPVSVDVMYQFIEDKNVLVRWRDGTGPFNNVTHQANDNYKLGDDKWEPPAGGKPYNDADVMVANVRSAAFDVKATDVPPGMPMYSDQTNVPAPSPTDLNPRQLPAGIRLKIEFGPDTGNTEMLERATLYFPVYRGL